MESSVSIQEAKDIVTNYTEEEFVTLHYHSWLGMHNEFFDNSVGLSNYYNLCLKVYNNQTKT